jgi:hypothetical protein
MKRLALAVAVLVLSAPAQAQLAGDLLKGQTGLAAGTQAPEGLVLTGFVYDYYSTQLMGPVGEVLPTTGSLNVLAAPGLNLVRESLQDSRRELRSGALDVGQLPDA